ncbi:hypothetical protein K402DRAFT_437050 [Aulographum hederae CBS 113979]|uniref:C3H1-type domain-containing protein n=1 Tax=Aulographum hederae CBS 113979 TaxID=1176131 RepID=A0A6G1GQ46_9PEZI|nr:hypothetical protein K402DRAFT_437050 [Aulographum hederae CBS 113979]
MSRDFYQNWRGRNTSTPVFGESAGSPAVSESDRPHDRVRTRPKDFDHPLTCFYWANGGCKKSAMECHYAHWETGYVSEAPVSNGRESVAGKNASRHYEVMRTQEQILAARENAVKAREERLREHQSDVEIQAENNAREKKRLLVLEEQLKEQQKLIPTADVSEKLQRDAEDLDVDRRTLFVAINCFDEQLHDVNAASIKASSDLKLIENRLEAIARQQISPSPNEIADLVERLTNISKALKKQLDKAKDSIFGQLRADPYSKGR